MPEPAVAPRRLALLRIGSAGMVLDQREVLGVEARRDVHGGAADGAQRIDFGAGPCPVFALDEALAPVALPEAPGRVCAMLTADGAVFGLVCDELEILHDAALGEHPLPAAMRRPGTPVLGLVRTRDRLAVRSSAQALARHFGLQQEAQ
jgi:hypothetical protein